VVVISATEHEGGPEVGERAPVQAANIARQYDDDDDDAIQASDPAGVIPRRGP
jgi:hypothetical protein